MTNPPAAWQAPEVEAGPAPGVAFATPGARLIAYIIDVVVNIAVASALFIVTLVLAFVLPILSVLGLLAIIIVPLVYFPYFWVKSGQTPGMRSQSIKVVRDSDGGPIGTGSAILRLIGYSVSGAVFYLGYVWIFIDKRKRGWHDLIAGTVVVQA
jgi:uncharacterized RDD family membrane protein YckC